MRLSSRAAGTPFVTGSMADDAGWIVKVMRVCGATCCGVLRIDVALRKMDMCCDGSLHITMIALHGAPAT